MGLAHLGFGGIFHSSGLHHHVHAVTFCGFTASLTGKRLFTSTYHADDFQVCSPLGVF